MRPRRSNTAEKRWVAGLGVLGYESCLDPVLPTCNKTPIAVRLELIHSLRLLCSVTYAAEAVKKKKFPFKQS